MDRLDLHLSEDIVMQLEKSSLGWIAGAAALVGGAVYLVARNDIRVRMTPDRSVALDREIARLSADKAAAGAGVTAAVVLAGLGLWAWSKRREIGTQKVEETIDVNVPVSTAYNQWTQFEDFPRFMPTVQEVKQLDDRHLHWRANVAGRQEEWDSEITEQVPDQMIAWRSTNGPGNAGLVTFDKIGQNKTRVKLQMWYDPQTTGEKVGSMLGGVKLTAKGNLRRFKQLLEARGAESGAWRGEISPTH
jgi:uncharacterized membrane protein